jgi:hypothetical protein
MNMMKKATVTLFAGAMLAGGIAAPAAAASKQDGLVNVNVGDVTILQDVNIAAAIDAVVQLCGLDVDAALLLLSAAETVDQTSRNTTVCKTEDGKVKITQN